MKTSRRRLLKSALLFSAIGAGMVLGVEALAAGTASESGAVSTPDSSSEAASGGGSSSPDASLKVKVLYLQMPQTIPVTEEYYVLQSPAYFRDLLSEIEKEYPVISTMIPTMMIFVDGYVAQPTTPLDDGDEIDFVPSMAGG